MIFSIILSIYDGHLRFPSLQFSTVRYGISNFSASFLCEIPASFAICLILTLESSVCVCFVIASFLFLCSSCLCSLRFVALLDVGCNVLRIRFADCGILSIRSSCDDTSSRLLLRRSHTIFHSSLDTLPWCSRWRLSVR